MAELQDFCLRWSSYTQQLSESFRTLLDRELLVDVTLACDGRSLRAHRAVLSACSSYFQDLFQENTHPHPIVILKDVRYQELEALVRFMYHGEVTVNHDTLPGFLRTAETLHIRGLTDGAFSGHATAGSPAKVISCTRRPTGEDHDPLDRDETSTSNEALSPTPKRIKVEQPSTPHYAHSSRLHHHQDLDRSGGSCSGSGNDVSLQEQQDPRCMIRTDDVSPMSQDQFGMQRTITSLDGLSQLVMPVLQDEGSQNSQYLGMCQNMSSHQQQHTSQQQHQQQHQHHSQHSSNSGSSGGGGPGGGRPFRQRVLYNQEQLLQLEAWYRQDRYPSGALMREYADTLAAMAPNTPGSIGALPMRQNVDYWFQNRRRKDFHPEVMQQREKKKLAKTLWGNYNSTGNSTNNNGTNNPSNSSSEGSGTGSSNHYSCSAEAPSECSMLVTKPVFSPEILHHQEKN